MKREGKLEKKGFWRMALLIAALYGTVIPAGAVILDEELLPRLQAINAAANDTDRAPLLQTLVHDLGGQLNEPTVKQLLAVANGNGLTEVIRLLEPLRKLREIEAMAVDGERYTTLGNFLNGLGDISAYLRPFPVAIRKEFNSIMERLLLPKLQEVEGLSDDTARGGALQSLIQNLGGVNAHAAGWLLLLSAGHGLENTVRVLLTLNVNVLARDALGRTPLNLAVRGDYAFVKRQVVAVRGDYDAITRQILGYMKNNGASMGNLDTGYMRDIRRARLLMVGIEKAFVVFKEFGFDNFPSADLHTSDLRTLALASELRQPQQAPRGMFSRNKPTRDLENWMVANKLSIHSFDAGRQTLLYAAILDRNEPESALRGFLQMPEVEPDAKNTTGQTPLVFAIERCPAGAKRTGMIRMLLEAGADVNIKDKDGMSPLWLAATKVYSLERMRMLLEYGADGNTLRARKWDGSSLLHVAAEDLTVEHLEHLNFLLEYGADINWRKDRVGETVLHLLCGQYGPVLENEVMQQLAASNCEFNAIAWIGSYTALNALMRRQEPEGVRLLLAVTEGMFREALSSANAAEIIAAEVLTQDAQELRKLPQLLTGVSYHPEVIEALLRLTGVETEQVEKEVSVEVTAGSDENDPIVVCTQDGVEIQPRNFRKDLDGTCWATRDILHTTGENAGMSRADVQQRLADLLANKMDDAVRAAMASFVNVREVDGRTALFLAVIKESSLIVELLLQQGVRLDLKDRQGKTVFHLAARLDGTEIIQMLLDAFVQNFRREKGWLGMGPDGKLLSLTSDQAVEVATAVAAEMNRPSAVDGPPLHNAVSSLKPEMVRWVLKAPEMAFRQALGLPDKTELSQEQTVAFERVPKVDVNEKDLAGRTPLVLAELLNEFISLEYDESVITARNAIVKELQGLAGDDGKRYAAWYRLDLAIVARDQDRVKAILEANPDIDLGTKNSENLTLLELAVRQRNVKILGLLLNYMAATERFSAEIAKSILRFAINKGGSNVTAVLLDYMIAPGRVNAYVDAVFAAKGRVDAWKSAEDAAEDGFNVKNDGKGFEDFQMQFKDVETRIEEALAISPQSLPPSAPNFDATVALFRAVRDRNVEDVRNALTDGASVNEGNVEGEMLLGIAVGTRDIEVIRILLNHMTTPQNIRTSADGIGKNFGWEGKNGTRKENHAEILQLLREAMEKVAARPTENYPILDGKEPDGLKEFVLNTTELYPIPAQVEAGVNLSSLNSLSPSDIGQAYRSLPPSVRDYLQRLGVVVPNEDTIRCTRELHLIFVTHKQTTEPAAIWRWKGNLQGLYAVRIFSFPKQRVQFAEPFDVPAAGGTLRVASLPNGFLKKPFPYASENADQFRLLLPQRDPTESLKFFMLIMTPERVYATKEIIPSCSR